MNDPLAIFDDVGAITPQDAKPDPQPDIPFVAGVGIVSPPTATNWTPRFAMDIAMALELGPAGDVAAVLKQYGVSDNAYSRFTNDPVFVRQVEAFRSEVRDKGVTFKLKARVMAEELLNTSWAMIHDKSISSAVRADLIKQTVTWSGLAPKDAPVDAGNAGGVAITINLGGASQQVKVQPAVIDGGVSDVGD